MEQTLCEPPPNLDGQTENKNQDIDWAGLSGKDWRRLRCSLSFFVQNCNCRKLSGRDWCLLLRKHPELASKCNWKKLNGREWAFLLCKQPRFAKKCNWWKLNGDDWGLLLSEQPQFSVECDWNSFCREDWDDFFTRCPDFEWDCETSEIDDQLLLNQLWIPENHIPEKEKLQNWGDLLAGRPHLQIWPEGIRADLPLEVAIEQANCGKEFGGDDWVYILQRNPNLSGYCDWHKLSADNWVDLLVEQPQLSLWCDWEKLDGADWSLLLQHHPSLAKRCNWYLLTGEDWCNLLCKQPLFSKKCDWKKLNYFNWRNLLRERPEFERIKLLKERETYDDLIGIALLHSLIGKQTWDMLNATMWGQLLARCPQYACHCNWEKFSAGSRCGGYY